MGEILAEHDIQDADIESSLETLVKEYNKQDGQYFYPSSPLKLVANILLA